MRKNPPKTPLKLLKIGAMVVAVVRSYNSIYQIEFARTVRLEVVCVTCPCEGMSARRRRLRIVSAMTRYFSTRTSEETTIRSEKERHAPIDKQASSQKKGKTCATSEQTSLEACLSK